MRETPNRLEGGRATKQRRPTSLFTNMPTKLKISNAAADPLKWDATFKKKLADAGDAHFYTQQIFSKWWKKGLSALFLSPKGAELELSLDADAKKFTWLIKPGDAKAGTEFFAKNPALKAVSAHKGLISGPAETKETETEEKPGGKSGKSKEEESLEEEAENNLDSAYKPLLDTLEKALAVVDEPGKAILRIVQKKVQEEKEKNVADLKPMQSLVKQALEKVKKEMEARKKDPATGITPPSHEELAKQREAAEIKFRKDQREKQKAAEKRKAEAAEGKAESAEEEGEDEDRWIPTVGDLPLYGQLGDDQKASVRSKLEEYNDRGKGGHSHRGVGGVLTLDLTGPTWGTARRGEWRLQIDVKGRTLNIVNHANKTWNG